VAFNCIFVPLIGGKVDEGSLRAGREWLGKYLPIIDNQLLHHPYVVSEQLTLADFCLLSVLDPAEAAGYDLGGFAAVSEWREKMKARPFYQQCHSSYEDAVKKVFPGGSK